VGWNLLIQDRVQLWAAVVFKIKGGGVDFFTSWVTSGSNKDTAQWRVK